MGHYLRTISQSAFRAREWNLVKCAAIRFEWSTSDHKFIICRQLICRGMYRMVIILVYRKLHIEWLVQERRNSSALAMELRLSCINPLINVYKIWIMSSLILGMSPWIPGTLTYSTPPSYIAIPVWPLLTTRYSVTGTYHCTTSSHIQPQFLKC